MRRLLMAVLLSYSFAVSAQTDDRRIRTVEIDTTAQRAEPADAPRDGAEHPDEHMVLARQLVNLGSESDAPADAGSPCVPAPEALRKEIAAAYRARPADFHGISPQSAYWPEVEKAWRDYYVLRCGAHNDESPAQVIARIYAATLSTAQLREVVAFQDSPSGRAFIAATQRAREQLEGASAPRAKRDPAEASTTFLQAMLRLKAKYESAPK
ncbi:MAG TPA: DUF2059 domain-containing protein [Telluria sp.]|nr:DUF2059 domain-containing protein [Telluria sp.]